MLELPSHNAFTSRQLQYCQLMANYLIPNMHNCTASCTVYSQEVSLGTELLQLKQLTLCKRLARSDVQGNRLHATSSTFRYCRKMWPCNTQSQKCNKCFKDRCSFPLSAFNIFFSVLLYSVCPHILPWKKLSDCKTLPHQT